MDIRCPACATLYEFDDAQLGPDGTSIRCSACGQVFRVRPSSSALSSCMVRRALTGEITHFDDLRTLQRWIADSRIQPDDWISKTGHTWRHLYEIEEIAAWFAGDEPPAGRVAKPGDTYPPRAARTENATFAMGAVGAEKTVLSMPGLADQPRTPATAVNPGLTPRPTSTTPATPAPLVSRQPVAAPIHMRPRGLTPAAQLPVTNAPRRVSEWSIGPESPVENAAPRSAATDTAAMLAAARPASAWGGAVRAVGLLACGVLVGVLFARPQVLGLRTDPISMLRERGPATDVATPPGAVEPAAVPSVSADATPPGSGAQAPILPPTTMPNPSEGSAPSDVVAQGAPTEASPAANAPAEPEPEQERRREATLESLTDDAAEALDAGRVDEALMLYEQAADRFDRAEAHTGMARAYEALGRLDLAAARYRRALQRNDRYAPAWLGLADVLRSTGDAAGAVDAYEHVIVIVPSGSMRQRAERALDSLR